MTFLTSVTAGPVPLTALNLVLNNMSKTKKSLALGDLHQLWENWREIAFNCASFCHEVKSTHQPHPTICTPQTIEYRAAKENGGKESNPTGKGELVVAEKQRFFSRGFSFSGISLCYWILRSSIRGRKAIIHPGLELFFYHQGSTSWEGMWTSMLTILQKMRPAGFYWFHCVWTACLCIWGRISLPNVHLRALRFLQQQTIPGNSR